MFHIGYEAIPAYAIIYVEKVTFTRPISSPLFLRVQRKKSTKGLFTTAFSAETEFKLVDASFTAHFGNEFDIPITVYVKKGIAQKKVVEILVLTKISSKQEAKEVALWKFDAANLPDPSDVSVHTSVTNSIFGEATLYLRFVTIPQNEFHGEEPKEFYAQYSKNVTPAEYGNTIVNNGVSDIEVEEKTDDMSKMKSKKKKKKVEKTEEKHEETESEQPNEEEEKKKQKAKEKEEKKQKKMKKIRKNAEKIVKKEAKINRRFTRFDKCVNKWNNKKIYLEIAKKEISELTKAVLNDIKQREEEENERKRAARANAELHAQRVVYVEKSQLRIAKIIKDKEERDKIAAERKRLEEERKRLEEERIRIEEEARKTQERARQQEILESARLLSRTIDRVNIDNDRLANYTKKRREAQRQTRERAERQAQNLVTIEKDSERLEICKETRHQQIEEARKLTREQAEKFVVKRDVVAKDDERLEAFKADLMQKREQERLEKEELQKQIRERAEELASIKEQTEEKSARLESYKEMRAKKLEEERVALEKAQQKTRADAVSLQSKFAQTETLCSRLQTYIEARKEAQEETRKMAEKHAEIKAKFDEDNEKFTVYVNDRRQRQKQIREKAKAIAKSKACVEDGSSRLERIKELKHLEDERLAAELARIAEERRIAEEKRREAQRQTREQAEKLEMKTENISQLSERLTTYTEERRELQRQTRARAEKYAKNRSNVEDDDERFTNYVTKRVEKQKAIRERAERAAARRQATTNNEERLVEYIQKRKELQQETRANAVLLAKRGKVARKLSERLTVYKDQRAQKQADTRQRAEKFVENNRIVTNDCERLSSYIETRVAAQKQTREQAESLAQKRNEFDNVDTRLTTYKKQREEMKKQIRANAEIASNRTRKVDILSIRLYKCIDLVAETRRKEAIVKEAEEKRIAREKRIIRLKAEILMRNGRVVVRDSQRLTKIKGKRAAARKRTRAKAEKIVSLTKQTEEMSDRLEKYKEMRAKELEEERIAFEKAQQKTRADAVSLQSKFATAETLNSRLKAYIEARKKAAQEQEELAKRQKTIRKKAKKLSENVQVVNENSERLDEIIKYAEDEKQRKAIIEKIRPNLHVDNLSKISLHLCAKVFANLFFRYIAVPIHRDNNFAEQLIKPLKEFHIFEFSTLNKFDINKLFEPIIKCIKFAVNSEHSIEDMVGILSTVTTLGLSIQTIACEYTNNYLDVIAALEKEITQIMNLLIQMLFSTIGSTIMSDGTISFDEESDRKFRSEMQFFSSAIDKYSIPEEMIQAIVVGSINYFDALLFNVYITSSDDFSKENADALYEKTKEIQKLFHCLPNNFQSAFKNILELTTVIKTLTTGTELKRMQRKPGLYRYVAEKMHDYILPDGVTLNDISKPVSAESLKVPLPDLGFDFTYQWLFTTSANDNYDENTEDDEEEDFE